MVFRCLGGNPFLFGFAEVSHVVKQPSTAQLGANADVQNVDQSVVGLWFC
jgi:hypothetical protein